MKKALPAALLALLVLAMWELLVRLFSIPAFLLPGPSSVAGAFWESRDLLLRHAIPTVGEAVLGLLVAAATGTFSGLLINRSPLAERSLYPWLVVSPPDRRHSPDPRHLVRVRAAPQDSRRYALLLLPCYSRHRRRAAGH